MMEPCSAIILAGGQSRRMRRPKAWLGFHGRPLLAHMVDLLSESCDEVIVVAAPGQELPETSARVVRDEVSGKGPVAGLATGFMAVRHSLAFATAVDAPLLQLEVIDLLRARLGESEVVLPEWDGRLQPLCAVYRVSPCLAVMEDQLHRGELRLTDSLARLNLIILSEAAMRRVDPSGCSFMTANTPEEFSHLLTFAR